MITISRTDFERSLPVGQSVHDSVFDKLLSTIEEQTVHVEETILGDAGVAMLENNERLVDYVKRYICVSAFLSVLRQLDLVLTQTGFGIVSSDKVSPASKQRVDALDGSLRTQERKLFGLMTNMLRSEEWGKQPQAKQCLPYIYTPYDFFFGKGPNAANHQDWTNFLQTIAEADDINRKVFGNEQMDAIAEAYRCRNSEVATPELLARLHRFTDALATSGSLKALGAPAQSVFLYIEAHLDIYTVYANSKEYKANHHEHFQNTKDSSAYVFG